MYPHRGLVADGSMRGPTATSNWFVPDRMLMGNDPCGGSKLDALLGSGVHTFVDLRDEQQAVNYLSQKGEYGARQTQKAFIYHLIDRAHAGQILYIHDTTGHGRCGVVAGCLKAYVKECARDLRSEGKSGGGMTSVNIFGSGDPSPTVGTPQRVPDAGWDVRNDSMCPYERAASRRVCKRAATGNSIGGHHASDFTRRAKGQHVKEDA
eukprot:gene36879-5116_t